MGRDLYHSSEGQTWRKHKYIRKEGNRYIYPEDVKNGSGKKPPSGTARDILNRQGVRRVEYETHNQNYGTGYDKGKNSFIVRNTTYKDKQGNYKQYTDTDVFNSDGSKYNDHRKGNTKAYNVNYKFNEERKLNSHKLVANGGKAEHTKKQLNDSHDQAKKDVSKLNTSGFVAMHQPKNFDKNGNPKRWRSTVNMNREAEAKAEDRFKKNAKTAVPASVQDQKRSVRMDERRRNSSNQMPESDRKKESELAKAKRDENARKSGNQAVENAKNAQERAKASNANKPVKAPKEYYDALRSNTKNEKEFNDYLDKHNVARPDGSKPTTKNAQKVETWNNSKNIKTWDDKTTKKSTNNQKGHFTLSENGETIFVPDDKKTEKRVSKGKQIVDKIKSTFSKKKK